MLEYNTTRNKLFIPEYGRNVQKMVEFAQTLPDRDERTRLAYVIVGVMAQLSPVSKDIGDLQHKLWDHIHIISDYKLDVDSPYPMPDRKLAVINPNKPVQKIDKPIRYRYYGRNIENIIAKAAEYEDGPEKDALIKTIANHLKKSYITWNRESIQDQTIDDHLQELSRGKLSLNEEMKLEQTSDIIARNKVKKKPEKVQKNSKYSNGHSNNFRQKKRY